MSKLTIYLAGKMTGLTQEEMTGWRKQAKELLEHPQVEIIDPTDLPEDTPPEDIVKANKEAIRRSDIILAEFSHPRLSPGTVGEIVYNGTLPKPAVVVACRLKDLVLSPWMWVHIDVYRPALEDAIWYIKRYYFPMCNKQECRKMKDQSNRCRDCWYMPTDPKIDKCARMNKQVREPDVLWPCAGFEARREDRE